MAISNSVFLLVLNFCHFLSAGIIMPFVARQVRQHGGNHIVTGSLQSCIFIAHLMSRDFVELYESNKKLVMAVSIYCCFVYYILFVIVSAWWAVFLIRIAYALTTQVLAYSKEYVVNTEDRSVKVKICNLLDIMRIAGLCLGSVASGYIFEYSKDFSNNAKVAACLGLVSICCLHQLNDDDYAVKPTESLIFSYSTITLNQIDNWRRTKIRKEWDDVLLKLSYVYTFAIYFSRSSFLLRYNYFASNIILGWSKAYNYILKFIFDALVPFVKSESKDKVALLETNMAICIVSLVGLYFAPNYKCFLICNIPLLFSYTLVNSLFADDVLKFKTNANVKLATETNTRMLNVIAPITFGVISQFFGPQNTKFLSLTPTAFHAILLNKRFFKSTSYARSKSVSLYSYSPTEVSTEELFIIEPNDDENSSDEEPPVPSEKRVKKTSFRFVDPTESEDNLIKKLE